MGGEVGGLLDAVGFRFVVIWRPCISARDGLVQAGPRECVGQLVCGSCGQWLYRHWAVAV